MLIVLKFVYHEFPYLGSDCNTGPFRIFPLILATAISANADIITLCCCTACLRMVETDL